MSQTISRNVEASLHLVAVANVPQLHKAESESGPKQASGMESRTVLVEVTKPKPYPRVGDSIAIRHQVKRSQDGQTVLGYQRMDKPALDTITAVYLDGTVRAGKSDVWEVAPGTEAKADRGALWGTVNPDRANG